MSDLPPFLAALELEPGTDPDERALRRAYARRLKQIDVEAEPARFQALREALDQGLRWVAWRDRQRLAQAPAPAPGPEPLPELATRAAPTLARPDAADAAPAPHPRDAPRARREADAGATPPSATEASQPDPDALAAAVFARFQRCIDDGLADAEATRTQLLRFLADPDLVSIDARVAFELAVAQLLGGAWRPGHEHLLDPAIEVFGWNSDHARLKHFGQLGMLLTAAIRDRGTVQAFGPAQRIALDTLLARIRSQVPPDPALLAEEVPQLQMLVERVPNWLRIVSPVAPVNQRFELWSQRPPAPPPAPAGPVPRFVARKPASAWGPGGLILAGLLILLTVGREMSIDHHERPLRTTRIQSGIATPADEADLARRQKAADAMLARLRQPGGVAR